jgi:hypothetical protein
VVAELADGGGGVGTTGVLGATSANDLVKRLTAVNDAFTDLTFQVATNGISQKAAAQQFDKLTKEFAVLEKQANKLTVRTSCFRWYSIWSIKVVTQQTFM